MSDLMDGGALRRFACTACGQCCDRGPVMELSEAVALSDTFVTSLIFKVHSIPRDDRTASAERWWLEQGSRLPLPSALIEKRRYSSLFATRRRTERRNDREVYLTIFAIVEQLGSKMCPALFNKQCGIYDRRPLTCHTVPLHYSRPPSVLQGYLDDFVKTPGYKCNTLSSPAVLDGNSVISSDMRSYRDQAIAVAQADRKWKDSILSIMDDRKAADQAGLPTYETVLRNFDNGYATFVPMIIAWRIAQFVGLISSVELQALCQRQVVVIKEALVRSPADNVLPGLLSLYETEAGECRSDSNLP